MAPYLSVDIETTGLDPTWCQVIEIGAIFDDGTTPIAELPRFHCYVDHGRFQGDPFALSMHAEIFRRIAKREAPFWYLKPEEVAQGFADWCKERKLDPHKLVAGGKNFASFDKNFLDRLPNWNKHVRFRHRFIDPAMLYWKPAIDSMPPDTATCLLRANMDQKVDHTALADAEQIVGLVRHASKFLTM